MSLTLYLSDAEADQFVHFAHNSDALQNRKNIGFHVVYKEGNYYPINYLRNIALENVETGFVFLSDIDFLPGVDTYNSIKRSIHSFYDIDVANKIILPKLIDASTSRQARSKKYAALVVAAFETQRYRLEKFPRTKAETLNLLDVGTLLTFRYHVWTKGHKATDYARWRTATTPYRISWEPDFEPYLVLPTKFAPKFDTRFAGFGWNKVSYTMELEAMGFDFVVLPNVFAIHMPHAPSLDIAKFRSSDNYRRCLRLLKEAFVEDMRKRYNRTFRITSSQRNIKTSFETR